MKISFLLITMLFRTKRSLEVDTNLQLLHILIRYQNIAIIVNMGFGYYKNALSNCMTSSTF